MQIPTPRKDDNSRNRNGECEQRQAGDQPRHQNVLQRGFDRIIVSKVEFREGMFRINRQIRAGGGNAPSVSRFRCESP